MTLEELELRRKAYRLQQVDKERDLHWQAWLNRQVKAMKEVGKKQEYIFKKFKDFYDYEKHLNDINNNKINDNNHRLINIAIQENDRGYHIHSTSVESKLSIKLEERFR